MKLLAMLTMSAAVLASTTVFTNAFAQDTTRADADPTSQQQVVRNDNAQHTGTGEGPGMTGMSQSGQRAMTPNDTSNSQKPCVGPVSYCNIYFGS
ncbi:DUF4148 domain-containing protein [Paraburkholderia sp. 2C]|jgi:hypothetical protein